jgi:hypothetical protein
MDDQARMAQTEATFREVNETIAKTTERFDGDEATFVCECSDPDCVHKITAEIDDYEDVRAEPTRFLVAPGHHEPLVERVVERTREYFVVEKVARRMAQIVRRLNPRAKPA